VKAVKMAADNEKYVSDSELGLEPGSLVPGSLVGEPTEDETVVAQDGPSDIYQVTASDTNEISNEIRHEVVVVADFTEEQGKTDQVS